MCSALPMGAPNTVMPCCSGGKDWSPTHVAAPRSSVFGGWCPVLFQMRVLPPLSRMRAVSCKWCANRS